MEFEYCRLQENFLRVHPTMETASRNMSCEVNRCEKPAISALAGQPLCLDDFCARCYERLDELEPMVRGQRTLDAERAKSVRLLLQECADQALAVCLRHEPLSNRDRSRLLQILLQSGELQVLISGQNQIAEDWLSAPQ